MASTDLRNAYYSIDIAEDSRKYLRFVWQGQLHQYRVLPMGLSSSPQIFTRLMKVLFAIFRADEIQ